jgi:hypothetical protein
MLSEDELRDALLLVFANKQVGHYSCLVYLFSGAVRPWRGRGVERLAWRKTFCASRFGRMPISLARRPPRSAASLSSTPPTGFGYWARPMCLPVFLNASRLEAGNASGSTRRPPTETARPAPVAPAALVPPTSDPPHSKTTIHESG